MIADGPHTFDLYPSMPEYDPSSVIKARQLGAQLIAQWVAAYNSQKTSIPMSNPVNMFNLAYNLGGYTAAVNDTLTGSTLVRNSQVLNASAAQSAAAV